MALLNKYFYYYKYYSNDKKIYKGKRLEVDLKYKQAYSILFTFSEHDTLEIVYNPNLDIKIGYISSLDNNNTISDYITISNDIIINENSNINYLPGIYEIIIDDFVYYFEVKSNKQNLYLDLDYLLDTIRDVDEHYLYLRNNYQKNYRSSSNSEAMITVLEEYYGRVKHVLDNINYNIGLTETLVKEQVLGKQNIRSIRKNIKYSDTGFFYNVKKVLSFKNDDDYYGNILNKIKNLLLLELDNLKNQYTKLLSRSKNEDKYNYLLDDYLKLSRYSKQFTNIPLDYFKLNKVDSKNKNQLLLEELYNKLNNNLQLKYNDTPLLFEYYCHILLHNIIVNNGFTTDTYYIDNTIPLKYKKDNYNLELIYDRKIEEDYHFCNSLVKLNQRHDRPDFVINLFKDNKIVTSVVIDAKYREYNRIIEDKQIEATALDYFQFGYATYDEVLRPVRKVLFLCLGDDETHIDKVMGFIGLTINDKINESKAYIELCKILNKYLFN